MHTLKLLAINAIVLLPSRNHCAQPGVDTAAPNPPNLPGSDQVPLSSKAKHSILLELMQNLISWLVVACIPLLPSH